MEPRGILHQLPDGEELQNALFDLLQPVVVFLKNLLGAADIADFFGFLFPGDGQQPIKVIPRDGGLRRHGRHHFQTLELGHGVLEGVLGHARRFQSSS